MAQQTKQTLHKLGLTKIVKKSFIWHYGDVK